ncbi:MAG: hypothetical protein IT334_04690 [Thermomicrobiales bacterium]|nr:hypothetical protein [Thermomicrobiales bacterium]
MASLKRYLAAFVSGLMVLSLMFVASGSSVTAQTGDCGVVANPYPERTTMPLRSNTNIVQGQQYFSASGQHYLLFQTDGNLVVNDATNQTVWSLSDVFDNTSQIGCVTVGADGNLVAKTADGNFLWAPFTDASSTIPDQAGFLVLNQHGALQIWSIGRGVVWSSDGSTTSEFDWLQSDLATCRTGIDLLAANPYEYPEDPATDNAGKRAWSAVYDEFEQSNLPACQAVGAVISSYQGLPVLSGVQEALDGLGVSWNDLIDGDRGITNPGSRISEYCPGQHQAQFDCVQGSERIASSIAGVQQVLDQVASVECLPTIGWGHCLQMSEPKMTIIGATTVSRPAMDLVKTIYTEMTSRLTDDYPKDVMDGFVVYVTNGGVWDDVSQLSPVGAMWPDTSGPMSGNELRGGASRNYLWVDEQMMCKTGVQTRNADYEAGTRSEPDNSERTVDQIVHEFAHSLNYRYNMDPMTTVLWPQSVEDFPWAVQGMFNAPASSWDNWNADQQAFVEGMFGPRTDATFDCSGLPE